MHHLTIRFTIILFLLTPAGVIFAQEIQNVDEAFSEAQELAFAGEREEARTLGFAILEIAPTYHEVRLLIARTYSWDEQYDKSREQLEFVLERVPNHKEALIASIDNELWAEQYNSALEIAATVTRFYPSDQAMLLKSARAYHSAGKNEQALRIIDRIDQINPSNSETRQLRNSIAVSGQNYILTGSFTNDWFSDIFGQSRRSFGQLARRTNYGSIIGRVNYASRFDSHGFQPEIDFYPSIADGWYGYLNTGYTSSSLFPEWRLGAELFKSLPRSFEVSAGVRHLIFESGGVSIITGSLTKYYGNWMFTARPFFTPSDVGISRSINLLARRYFSGAGNYVTLRGGFGFSPEERRFQLVPDDVFQVGSQYLGIDGAKELRYDLSLFVSFDIARQELTFDPGNNIFIYTLNVGFAYKF